MQTRFAQLTLASWQFSALGILAFFSLVPNASANALGSMNEANCGGGGVSVSSTAITWLPLGTSAGTGCIITGAGTNVTYSGGTLGAGVTGNILDLLAGGGAVDDFMTFQGTTLDFKLTGFLTYPSDSTNCSSISPGQTCVVFDVASGGPFDSPFLLTDLGGGNTEVSLTAYGTVLDGGVLTDWSGSFTTQMTMDPGTVQSTILGGGTISSTQSGSFLLSAVPEPATWTMLAAGLIALSLVARVRRVRS
jgi:hypothetical protein